MKSYLSMMTPQTKVKCLGVIALAFFGAMLASWWPVRLGLLYTDISNGTIKTLSQGLAAIVSFGLIYLLSEWIAILRRVALDCIIATHEAEVRETSVEKLLKMPVAYYSGSLSGEKTAQLNQGVAGFSQLIKMMCNDIFATILVAAWTLIQVFWHAPLIMVGLMGLYLALTVAISVFQIRSQNGIRERIVAKKNSLDGQICQSIANLELIRSLHAERYEKKRLLPAIVSISCTEKRHHEYMGAFDSLKQLCKIVFQVLILITSIALIANGKMAAGSVITVCLLFQQLIKPIDEVYRFMDETASSLVKARALLEVSSRPGDEVFEVVSSHGLLKEKDIFLEDVVVTNPEKDLELAWYDKVVIPGEKIVALQGPNGCGKSSLIKCLNRYYPHTRGKITLFGADQAALDQKELTEMVYYTPQSSFFIAGTIRDNLIYGLETPPEDDALMDALRVVHLAGDKHGDTVIRKDAQEALDVVIGEKAEELSGGMKQRLSLARALLRHPRLFVFDEITANLDQQAAADVLKGIEAYARTIKAGIVYISHDEHVVDRCDQVICLSNRLRSTGRAEAF